MRYEIPSFRIDKNDWMKGANSYDDYPEGGVLASTVGTNIFSKPGLVTVPPAIGSSITAALPKNGVISWGIGSGASAPSVVAVLTNASDNGYFGTVNSSTGAITVVGSADTTRSYKKGITDTVFYNGNFYTTSETDICIQDAALGTRTESWWIATKGKSALTSGIPHPLLVYESIMYIADGRYLHKLDGSTVSTQVFDVPPDHIITAMVEWNGLIYMVAEPYKNLTGGVHGLSQMFSWDGLSESWYEQYFLDYRVNALYVFKNTLYAWHNDFLGMWTGSEMSPVRPLSSQVFKCQITATANSMLYVDGSTIVRYGAPYIKGFPRKFFPYLSSAALPFAGIISVASNNLIASETHATASPIYYIANLDTPGTAVSKALTFNRRAFKQPVKMRGIVVEMEAIVSGQSVKVEYINDKGTLVTPTEGSGVINTVGATFKRFDIVGKDATRNIVPKVTITGGVHVRSIDYLMEASENKQGK